jgi:hypothetical protein
MKKGIQSTAGRCFFSSRLVVQVGAFFVAAIFLAGCSTSARKDIVATGINYEQDGAQTHVNTYDDMRAVRFCEIFFIKAEGDMYELHVYNPTGLNNMAATGDACPDNLVNKVDFAGLKEHYKLDAIYFNKPRRWMFDQIMVPVGAIRNFDGMDWYWMAASHMPKSVKMEPGFLTYKRAPVERKTELIYRAGKPVFLLDDSEGKVWVMKAFRDSYGQTYDNLKDLGSRYKSLPEGYRFRVTTLEKDLVLRPTEGTATVMQDEFENTFDYLGDGSSNYVP